MNIGLNASALAAPLTGVGQYVHHLAQGLLSEPSLALHLFNGRTWTQTLPPADTAVGTAVALSGKVPTAPNAPATQPSLRRRVQDALPEAWLDYLRRQVHQHRFTQGVKNLGLALYHEPNFLSFDFEGKLVLTVHDLSWIRYPQAHPEERLRKMARWFEPSLKRADHIITVSHFVKQELLEVFGLAENRITVVHNGVEPLFSPQSEQRLQTSLAPLQLKSGAYWLAVGTIEPRKNLETTLAAFCSLSDLERQSKPLVLVGPRGWGAPALQSRIDALVAKGDIRWLGFLAREQLAAVTAGAYGMLYPSLYEGFGLPPLEAMACGVPVIVSNASSLPEVVGTAGLLVEAQDAQALANQMRQLMQDPAHHHQHAQASLVQSQCFSWARCVQETRQVYAQLLPGLA